MSVSPNFFSMSGEAHWSNSPAGLMSVDTATAFIFL